MGAFLILLKFLAGFPLLLFGAEWVVKGASRLAVAWGISALVVGLTVVAYGTSAPELAVTIMATWAERPDEGPRAEETRSEAAQQSTGNPDIAIGNVVGSNIANILLVLGISAVVAPLIVAPVIVRRSMPLVVFISLLVLVFAWDWNGDGRTVITWWHGLILVAGAVGYTMYAMRRGSAENATMPDTDEVEEEFGHMAEGRYAWAFEVLRIVFGMAMLVLGASWLVDGAVAAATWLGVSQLIIALTIVAIGTSLPEVATCVVAVLRGHRDLAVGNAVGSNIFNILLVLGACAVVSPGGGVAISRLAMTSDIPVMIAVAAFALPIFYTGYVIARWEGYLFLGLYAAYTAYLVLREIQSPALGIFVNVMLYVVLPLAVLAVAAHAIAEFVVSRRRNPEHAK